jgi:hypothetical protein
MTGHERCRALLDTLKAKYPEVRLSFGYVGNCSSRYDDRSWRFFTKVMDPKDAPYTFSWGLYGGYTSENLDKMADDAAVKLEPWIQAVVRPHIDGVYRNFEATVEWRDAATVENLLHKNGASFGMRGGGRFAFSIRHAKLADIEKWLAPYNPTVVKETDY